MRLAYKNEDLSSLSTHELAFIVQKHDHSGMYYEHEAKRVMAEGELRRSKEKLRYLKNQNVENISSGTTGNNSEDICVICLNSFEGRNERAVLRCGHSFHHTPCLQLMMSRAGGGSGNRCTTISCPLRCSTKTSEKDILIASNRRKDDGSGADIDRKIEGSWGTKVDRIIIDVISVIDVGEKSIIFSQWDDMLDILEQALCANKISFVRPKTKRNFGDCINLFRSSNCFVLLMNVKNGAEGLTLVEATHVFMVEPLLNHGMDGQAINRIHRIGQISRTYVHRYIVEDTVEVKIDRVRMKRQEILFDDYETLSYCNKREQTFRAGGVDGGFNKKELQELLE